MSVIKRFEIQCDKCRRRKEWTMESVANSRGITKGSGLADLRKECKKNGWCRKELRRGVWIDLCPICAPAGTPAAVWFECK